MNGARTRTTGLAPLACALALMLSACGGSSHGAPSRSGSTSSTSGSTPTAPTPEETAVTKMARTIYPQQNITAAHCTKTGFNTTGDVDDCSLVSSDGTETAPQQWTIVRDSAGDVFATPPGE